MVRLIKETLTRMGPGNWQEKIDQFLLAQHITSSTTTNRSPAKLLMGWKLRCQLDRLHPNYHPKMPLDSALPTRSFSINNRIFAHNYAGYPIWMRA